MPYPDHADILGKIDAMCEEMDTRLSALEIRQRLLLWATGGVIMAIVGGALAIIASGG